MKHVICTTTINVPRNLEAYALDIAKHGPENTSIVIASDQKTPLEALTFCKELMEKVPVEIIFLTPAMQDEFMGSWPRYKEFLPWNCIQRRNVAFLYAYHALKADVIVTIDDDNYWESVSGEKYFEQHGKIGDVQDNLVVTSSTTGWINVCYEFLMGNFYPRGYSFKNRGSLKERDNIFHREVKSGRVVVNGGLWEGDPDIDAVTRISSRPESIALGYKNTAVLAPGTKCPFNSQNTALHRDVMPAYCMATGLGRYDDIIASYIVKRIADHLGDYISFGRPIVNQKRNDHDLFKDLAEEMVGMQVVDDFVDWLWSVDLKGKTYLECIKEIIRSPCCLAADRGQLAFFESLWKSYAFWVECFE